MVGASGLDRGAISRGCEGVLSATRSGAPHARCPRSRAPGAARGHDGVIDAGDRAPFADRLRVTLWKGGLPHNYNSRITRSSHMFTRHKISRRPRHPVSGGREARRGPHGHGVHKVSSAVGTARRWRGRWVRNQYHQASSRGVVGSRDRRAGPGSNGMMGSPTFPHLPRDRMGHSVALENVADVRRAAAVAVARGRRMYRAAGQISSESKLLARPERPMYVSKSPAETWEGPLRTHRRTARLSIWLVHFWPWTTRRKLLCIARTPSRWARGPAQQREPSILPHSCRKKQR